MKHFAFLIIISLPLLLCITGRTQGKFFTKSGRISFFSSTSMEDIEAVNRTAAAMLDSKSGDIQFAVLMKGFEFKKALMQEHFNKNYVESDRFPRAEFRGLVTDNNRINYTVNGNYTAHVKGKLTIHGETRDLETAGTLTVRNGKVILNAVFNVTVADYKIVIPKLYRDNISPSIKVTVDCTLNAM